MLADLVVLVRVWIAMSLVFLTMALGMPAVGLLAVRAEPDVTPLEARQCVPLGAEADNDVVLKGPEFTFLDHELGPRAGLRRRLWRANALWRGARA